MTRSYNIIKSRQREHMKGKILGYDIAASTGSISGEDGNRYAFKKEEWKETIVPSKEMMVDFEIDANSKDAKNIYSIKDTEAENNSMLMGLFALGITFFFGFIGTFVSRLILAKQPIEKTIVPTLIHFVVTLLLLIPILGWFIYLIGTLYYMVKNYGVVTKQNMGLPTTKYD